ncbi:MAG: TRAP transporter fused permease subunit [Thermofilum sp.]|nr:TRAP transporter fused permease subunit [Thermofilum sp.]
MEKLREDVIRYGSLGLAFLTLSSVVYFIFPTWEFRALHLGIVLALTFLVHPCGSTKKCLMADLVLIAFALFPNIYLMLQTQEITYRVATPMDIICCIMLVVAMLEATRRTIGRALAILVTLSILYVFLGPYLPGVLSHKGQTIARFADWSFKSMTGIYGTPLGVAATTVFLFIILGSLMQKMGAGEFIISMFSRLLGKYKGGPCYTACAASCAFGMFSGSAVANVAATGSFTIPWMKQRGVPAEFAGACEAASSTGGQIMPPIMGAAAFVMAGVLGVSYFYVFRAALLPALFYYISIAMGMYFFVQRYELRMESVEPFRAKDLINLYLLIPMILVIYLGVSQYSIDFAAFVGIIALLIIALAKIVAKKTTPKVIIDGLIDAGKDIIPITVACAAAGIITGALTTTGLSFMFSYYLVRLAGGNLFILLILAMILALILGMGMTTLPVYILASTLMAPALIELGGYPIAVHLFIFYYGVLAFITPPVALASYAAAGLAKSDFWKTSYYAIKLALVGFIVPYVFYFDHSLLLEGSVVEILSGVTVTLVAIFALNAGMWGRYNTLQRAALLAFGLSGVLGLILHSLVLKIIPFGSLLLIFILKKYRSGSVKSMAIS